MIGERLCRRHAKQSTAQRVEKCRVTQLAGSLVVLCTRGNRNGGRIPKREGRGYHCAYEEIEHRVLRRLVFQDDIQSMDDSGNVTQDRQEDVDEEISTTSALKEDTKRWEDDGENDLADITGCERHFDG